MRPEIYLRFFKHRPNQLCQYVKKHNQKHTFFHSCSSIGKLLPDLIDVGYEIINPVQINSVNMDPATLKQEFGSNITFWGGSADTRNVLTRSSPEEVKQHVTELFTIFSPGRRYIFNTVHNILPDVPRENIIAMVQAFMPLIVKN
jgi:uroporphyrinogen decarboxylase